MAKGRSSHWRTQPRDTKGKWTSTGRSAASKAGSAVRSTARAVSAAGSSRSGTQHHIPGVGISGTVSREDAARIMFGSKEARKKLASAAKKRKK